MHDDEMNLQATLNIFAITATLNRDGGETFGAIDNVHSNEDRDWKRCIREGCV
jgi:hypothetical protein